MSFFNPDGAAVETARRRHGAVWRNEEVDYVPILMSGPRHAEQKRFPAYHLKECYYDREKMLISHTWGMISICNGGGDAAPSMRCNTGVGTLATVFGCVSSVFEDKMPWITEHPTKEQLRRFEPVDIAEKGEMPRVLDYMSYFAEKLDGRARVYAADNQGPLDLAHIVYGDRLFTDLYDDPAFVHELLDKCTRVIMDGVKLMKQAVGEPVESGHHSNGLYMTNGGIRVCEDTTTLLGASMVEEFAMPYTARVLTAFDGGWVHFCGGEWRLLEQMVTLPGCRGVNFGNPERFDFEEVFGLLRERGQFYFGNVPRQAGESLEDWFRRILVGLGGRRGGLILRTGVGGDDGCSAPEAVALWRTLQDEML